MKDREWHNALGAWLEKAKPSKTNQKTGDLPVARVRISGAYCETCGPSKKAPELYQVGALRVCRTHLENLSRKIAAILR